MLKKNVLFHKSRQSELVQNAGGKTNKKACNEKHINKKTQIKLTIP